MLRLALVEIRMKVPDVALLTAPHAVKFVFVQPVKLNVYPSKIPSRPITSDVSVKRTYSSPLGMNELSDDAVVRSHLEFAIPAILALMWREGRGAPKDGYTSVNGRGRGDENASRGVNAGAGGRWYRLPKSYAGYSRIAKTETYTLAGGEKSILPQEWRLTNDYKRFALLATAPFLLCISLLFLSASEYEHLLRPRSGRQYHENSKYYSAIKPAANKEVDAQRPHITIELPVYKESLVQTMVAPRPFLFTTMGYNSPPSPTANSAYGSTQITPKHDDSEGGFKRRERLKKASNMNYGLVLSPKMEEIVRRLEIERGEKASLADSSASTDGDGGKDIEEQALRLAVEEIYEESGRRFKTWAHNAKALLMGEVILIADSDTIVREDSARELAESPMLQSPSMILKCENGEVTLFKGYIIRWATYSEGSFKEGVSLTCDEPTTNWTDGRNAHMWWRLGLVNKQLRIFLWLDAPVHYKVSMIHVLEERGDEASLTESAVLEKGIAEVTCAWEEGSSITNTEQQQRDHIRHLLAHLFSYNITWGATKKKVERFNLFIEVPRTLRRFWLALIISFLIFVMIVVFSTNLVPPWWSIPSRRLGRYLPACGRCWEPYLIPDRAQSLVDDLLILIVILASHRLQKKPGVPYVTFNCHGLLRFSSMAQTMYMPKFYDIAYTAYHGFRFFVTFFILFPPTLEQEILKKTGVGTETE
ncbi:hypothetical protein BGY98DRAFT_1180546 [Russula aff. rugulosa BPL654]|nr:hypothetical protein BGY98DRAFT_1180546 [Russula aff. rugulosa BPL654]